MVQEGSKRDILGETPGFSGVSRAHIPVGRISYCADRPDQTDRHRTNTKNRELLYNSPFGAIIIPALPVFRTPHGSEIVTVSVMEDTKITARESKKRKI